MIVRLVSGSTLRTFELTEVSQVVVMNDSGDPCVVARDLPDGTVIAGHAAEQDFPKLLRQVGVTQHTPIVKG